MTAHRHEQPSAATHLEDGAFGDGRVRQFVHDEAPRLYRILMFVLRGDEELSVALLRASFLDAIRTGPPNRETGAARRLFNAALERARTAAPQGAPPDQSGARSDLFEALAGLDMDQRFYLALCDVGGMTADEAATIFDIGRETCRRRLHEARTTLCRRLYGREAGAPDARSQSAGSDRSRRRFGLLP